MVILVVVCGIAVLISSILLFSRELNYSMQSKVDTAMNIVESEINEMVAKTRLATFSVSDNQNLSEAILNNDRDRISDIANTLKAMAQLDFCTVVDINGTVILRTYNLDNYGDSLANQSTIISALDGMIVSYIVTGDTMRMSVVASSPVYDEESNIVGAVSLGLRLDTQNFVHRMKEQTGCEVTIFLGDVRVSSTIIGEDGTSVLGTQASESVRDIVMSGKSFSDRIDIFGNDLLAKYIPLYGAGGEIAGMAFVGYYTAEDTEKIQVFILLGIVITLVVFAACVIIAIFISKAIELRLKNMMNEILAADEYARLMFDSTPISCVLWDKNLKIINCNEEALRFFGVERKEDFDDNAAFAPEYQPDGTNSASGELDMVRKAYDEGYVRREWMHTSLSGESLPCEVILVRVKHKDRYLVAEFLRDLREQKQHLEEIEKSRAIAEAANTAKSVFLANMSHEIRTPMNSIIGFSELAQDGDIPLKSKEYLENINDSAKWLLNIINDILDISKIESGKIVLENIPFDLPDIFEHCQMSIAPRAAEKGIALYCYAEPSFGKKLLGDPVRLRQIILNLLSNAVKFTNNGMVKLLASVVTTDADSATIHFETKDSGIGMTAEQIERIFEPFTQADDTVTRRFGGTGLGLTITKNLIELMGGELEVESAPGIGSKFSFDIKFDFIEVDEDTTVKRVVLSDFEKPNFEAEILVCEDNILNQQVIFDHLTRVGIKAVVASNGLEGVDIVAARMKSLSDDNKTATGKVPFDLIFMDIHMPIMDGLEAAKKMAELGVTCPIVALTANIMANDMEIYKNSGMLDTLGKPFTSQELWGCLLTYIPAKSYTVVNEQRQVVEDEKMQKRLKSMFIRKNQTMFADIMQAIYDDDIELAHRLVHTLKSNAGQINKTLLQIAAEEVETNLTDGVNNTTQEQLDTLNDQLDTALKQLQADSKESDTAASEAVSPVFTTQARALLEELLPLLEASDSESMELIDNLRLIPGSDKLIICIEEFDFDSAIKELNILLED